MTAINTRFSGQARHSVKTALVAGWLFMYTMPCGCVAARPRLSLGRDSLTVQGLPPTAGTFLLALSLGSRTRM